MNNTDPAVTAAQRAWDSEGWPPGSMCTSEGSLAYAAAREALAPVRAEIEAISNEYGGDDNVSQFVLGLLDRLARHVYSEEEL